MDDTLADMSNKDYAIGCKPPPKLPNGEVKKLPNGDDEPIKCESDLAINTNFFAQKEEEIYVVELAATNGQDARGIHIYHLVFHFPLPKIKCISCTNIGSM